MRVDEINERSVLLARQSSALTFLLNKFITQNAALATVGVGEQVRCSKIRTAHSQNVICKLKKS